MSKDIKFEKGDVIKCVDINEIGEGGLTMNVDYVVNKFYITENGDRFVIVLDDYGGYNDYFSNRFIKLSTLRNNIIEEILK